MAVRDDLSDNKPFQEDAQMTTTHPFIIETQLRLIRAFQRGYIEAIEAGDWQAAEYRGSHLQRLCQGLYYLSQSLDKKSSIPDPVVQRNANNWISSVRSPTSTHSLTGSHDATDKPMVSPPSPPDMTRYAWGLGSGGSAEPPQIDEVWQ
jgi:hypothetical protein